MDLGLFKAIVKVLPNPVLLCAADGRILAVNAVTTRQAPVLSVGANLFDLAVNDRHILLSQMEHWLCSGDPLPGALTVPGADGSLVRFRCHGARATWYDDGEAAVQVVMTRLDRSDRFVALSQQVAALNREVAFRRVAEAERERLLAAEHAGRVRLQHLYRLTASLGAATTLAAVVTAVHRTAPQTLGARGIALALHSQRLLPSLGPAEDLRALVGDRWTDLDQQPGRAAPPGAEPAHRPGTEGTEVTVELEADGLVLGNLTVTYTPGDTPAGPEHTTAVCQQIAQALRRAALYEHEHRLAERLQRSLLPTLPVVPGIDIAGRYAPGTDSVDVGGDWYDVHVLDRDHVGFTIGDVAGHGLAEATAMAQISTALRGIALRCGTAPGAVLTELNAFLNVYHHGLMATACYLVYDRRTRVLRYARTGHLPPLLIRPDGTSRYLDQATAPPLGPVTGIEYKEAEIALEGGEVLLLYTDGLIERRGETLDTGLARLTELARRTAGATVEELCDRFLDHHPDAEMPDDRALLTIRFPHSPAAPVPCEPVAPHPRARRVAPTPEAAGAAGAER
ncbi:hypothetical protein GCM10027168_62920 [Streptomyces capparidis]